jgi:hypothetical protein
MHKHKQLAFSLSHMGAVTVITWLIYFPLFLSDDYDILLLLSVTVNFVHHAIYNC